jgi:hypothetical protein
MEAQDRDQRDTRRVNLAMPEPQPGRPEGKPYLVYELREATPDSSRKPPSLLGADAPAPVRFSLEEHGCFFAPSAEEACQQAARSLNRLGDFVAVKATLAALDFATVEPPQAPAKGAAGGNADPA